MTVEFFVPEKVWKTHATRLEPTRGRLYHGTEVVQQSHQEEGKLLLFYVECEIFCLRIVLYIYKYHSFEDFLYKADRRGMWSLTKCEPPYLIEH